MAMPAASFAGTASTDGVHISYVANAGETNNVTVDLASSTYTITDTGPNVTFSAGTGCTLVSPTSATCPQPADPGDPLAPADHVVVVGGDMNDTIRINAVPRDGTRIDGGSGDDTLIGSPGADKISGGIGDDVIDPTDVGVVDLDIFNSFEPCDLEPFTTDIRMYHCPDLIDGDQGFNTLRFDSKPNGVIIDAGTRGPAGTVVLDPNRPANGDVQSNVLVKGIRGNFRTPRLIGTPAADHIFGSINNDTISGRGGADLMCGGPGNDTVDYSGSPAIVSVTLDSYLQADKRWESTDRDQWISARGDCRQTNTSGVAVSPARPPVTNPPPAPPAEPPLEQPDCIANDGTAGEGDCVGVDVENAIGTDFEAGDTFVGNGPGAHIDKAAFFEPRGANRFEGRGGNDTMSGGTGSDVLIGGEGADTVSYATYSQSVAVSLDAAANDGGAADLNPETGLGDSVGPDVENLIGGSGDDVLVGSAANNSLSGGGGNDTLQGEDGDDTLDGGAGNDGLRGGLGNDSIGGGAGDDTLDGGPGADALDGGDDSDLVDYSNSTTSVLATPDGAANDGSNDGAEGDNVSGTVESLSGGSAADILVGNGAPGVLRGNGGNDTLDGGAGPDQLIGGSGIDAATYAGRTGPVKVDLTVAGDNGEPGEGDVLTEIEAATGGSGDDTLIGDDIVNILSGGPGNDTLDGRGSQDTIFGGPGNDVATGGAGPDTVFGDAGDDSLQGGTEADGLNGGDGDDQMDGGPGNDTFTGGAGNDTVMYSSRTTAVDVTLDGADNDGEKDEKDQVRTTVESTKTGGGNDFINLRDGVKGNVSCGAGTDSVRIDRSDEVASDCEEATVGAAATCTIGPNLPKMNRRGVVRLRVRCARAGRANLRLRTIGRAKRAKNLGRKSVRLRAGRRATVRVKLTRTAKRLLRRHKGSLRAHTTVTLRGSTAARATKRSQNLTIMAQRWRRR